MNELAIEQQMARLEKEIRFAGSETDRCLLDLRVEVDRLKLELQALKTFLGAVNPSFGEQFPQILAQTIQEVDPESD